MQQESKFHAQLGENNENELSTYLNNLSCRKILLFLIIFLNNFFIMISTFWDLLIPNILNFSFDLTFYQLSKN